MANVEGLKHCPTCDAAIQRTPCGIPYCPNAACGDQKGAHDWEVIPIFLHMAATRRAWEAIGLGPRPHGPDPAARPAPTHCWSCGAVLADAPGIGLYCPDRDCEMVDGVALTPEQFRRSRASKSGEVLARALRRTQP